MNTVRNTYYWKLFFYVTRYKSVLKLCKNKMRSWTCTLHDQYTFAQEAKLSRNNGCYFWYQILNDSSDYSQNTNIFTLLLSGINTSLSINSYSNLNKETPKYGILMYSLRMPNMNNPSLIPTTFKDSVIRLSLVRKVLAGEDEYSSWSVRELITRTHTSIHPHTHSPTHTYVYTHHHIIKYLLLQFITITL